MDFHAEKQKAMARYNRLKHLTKIRRFFEFVVAFFFLSRLSLAGKLAGKSLVVLNLVAGKTLFTFFVFNSIIVLLFLLSRKNQNVENEDVKDPKKMTVFSESDFEISSPENFPVSFPVVAESFPANEKVVPECEAVEAAIEYARKQIRRFERTQSEKLKRDLMPRLKRSQTEKAISVVENFEMKRAISVVDKKTKRAISVIDRVHGLSNEEFQQTIEEFIAKQKKLVK